jgi:hypothetical protein
MSSYDLMKDKISIFVEFFAHNLFSPKNNTNEVFNAIFSYFTLNNLLFYILSILQFIFLIPLMKDNFVN